MVQAPGSRDAMAGKKATRQWTKIDPGQILDIQSYEDVREGSDVEGRGRGEKERASAVSVSLTVYTGDAFALSFLPQPRPSTSLGEDDEGKGKGKDAKSHNRSFEDSPSSLPFTSLPLQVGSVFWRAPCALVSM